MRSIHGDPLQVRAVQVWPEAMCEVVTLRTREAELRVSACHRIAVPAAGGGPPDERLAAELQIGQDVVCGSREHRLVHVSSHRMRTKLVDVQFDPDQPVESFNAPRWSIASRGAEAAAVIEFPDTDDEWH